MTRATLSRSFALLLVSVLLLLPAASLTQETEAESPWLQLQFLEGEWEGTGDGRWGQSTLERSYEYVLNRQFLRGVNTSTYAPQEKNPEGEVHTNWDVFSYDTERETFVFRQFHDEAFVNTYTMTDVSMDGQTLYFESEHIENFIPGWRARETYRILGPDEFTETFELASAEGEFEVFVTNHFTRKP
jgi:hypothetical protein